jgi:hypothetical protein
LIGFGDVGQVVYERAEHRRRRSAAPAFAAGLDRSWESRSIAYRVRAFKHEELSILFYSLLQNQGRTVQDALSGYSDNSLCSITAGLARELGQLVVYDVEPPNDPAHGLVVGKKTKAVANRFAREALWVIPTEPPLIGV